ncbi:LysM peptidoglycan-binding domain-containing protein [Rhodococcus spongiicola]|uniref:LysM peptidoglycan-binding domain-containing protein n=1 Tax=Rhodococcus spongiicola TaxID=2487352 RepID=A0A3S3A723_9NOCA|nr:LysM peptidoglycan-binding domain-containing protein [Rhodococcus spongiicola]RVW03537.1 LysM peptidoglycan-binding domain-containing protein [Rhodococcus spongiicola]
MNVALSGNGEARISATQIGAMQTGRRPAYRADRTRPSAGIVRYDEIPRRGVSRTRAAQTPCASHGRGRRRAWSAGFTSVVATVVVTAGVVVGMDTLARLAAAPDGIPTGTAAVQVRDGETLTAVASRVAPGAPVGRVVDRIMELNDMPGVSVRAGQTLLAPVSLAS